METGFPLVMLVGPVVMAIVALVVRKYRRISVIIGVATMLSLAFLLSLAAPGTGLFADNTVGFLGREAVMSPFVRSLFLFMYPAMGLIFLMAWARPVGRALVPAGLAVLSPLAAALMISPAGLGAVLLVAAAAVVVPTLHGGKFDAVVPAWRYFLLAAVALAPVLLVASGSMITTFPAGWSAPLLATLILLGGFPFHIWAGALGRHISPVVAALVLGLLQLVVVSFLLSLLDSVPGARAATEFQLAIRWSAALTALIGAFAMARAIDWRGVVAGAILLDMGLLLPAVLVPGTDGLMIAIPALIARYLALLLVGLGLAGRLSIEEPARLGRLPALLRPALLLYGLLSLIGLPLTPGFAGRWAQLAVVGQSGGMWPTLLLVFALAAATAAIVRMTRHRLAATAESATIVGTFSAFEFGLMLFLVVISTLIGLFPGLLIGLAARMLGLG